MISPLLFVVAIQGGPRLALIPKPMEAKLTGGAPFEIVSTTAIRDEVGGFAARYLEEMIASGGHLRLKTVPKLRLPGIAFVRAPGLPAEGYELSVTSKAIEVRSSTPVGAFYAVETLRQLLPTGIDSPKGTNARLFVPAVEIKDAPRFSWRGMHLDVSRHFFPVSFIKRYLDYIAMMKMNVFHWHLVDDGGWRLQIDKYPKLTSVGAWRYGVTTDWDQGRLSFDPATKLPKYGGFYTKAEVRDILKYAADRNITVVPEIEMPGHAMPVFAAYPELGCQNQVASTTPGQPATNVYCAGNDATYKFVDDVLAEVMDLFPSKWIHIGGDEVWKGYWQRCPLCQAKMKAEGLKNEEELQSAFIRHVDKFLSEHGRRMIGWDEILEGGLAQGATVMSWRGIDGGIAAAKSGHDVVMSPTSHCYFDYGYDGQPTEHVYTFEPVPEGLSPEEAAHILGGQANVWTEMIPTEAKAETMIWPRMAAMAEVLWSPKAERDPNEFRDRVSTLMNRLDQMGVNMYLPAPTVPLTAIVYIDYCRVEAKRDANMPADIRFSYGADPVTPRSELYKGPIYIVGGGQTVNLAYVTTSGRVGAEAHVTTQKAEPVDLPNVEPGWKLSIYEGQWSRVPDFAQLNPAKVDTADSVGLAHMPRPENAALRFEGYLKIDEPGVYTFSLASDDGAWLKVANAMVVNNDGLHAPSEKTGSVMLPKGWHRIEIGYFQAGGAASLSAAMNGKPLDGLVFRIAR